MKRTTLLAILIACLAYGSISAQTVNGVKLSELTEPYLEAYPYKRAFSEKVFVVLEYGQRITFDIEAGVVKNENRKPMEFNSMIDFVNKMKSYGYELLTTYGIASRDDRVTKYYVLKRKESSTYN